MATKKKKKKNSSGVGTAIYVVLLTLWILFLAAVCLYILSQVWAYASVYDDTQKEPVIEAYMAKLRENVWDNNIAATVAGIVLLTAYEVVIKRKRRGGASPESN